MPDNVSEGYGNTLQGHGSQLEEVPMDQSWDHLSTKLSKNNNELLFTEKHSNP